MEREPPASERGLRDVGAGGGAARGHERQADLTANDGHPSAGAPGQECDAFAITGQACGRDGAAVIMAGAAQDVSQVHGAGAKGTDN
ncbi:hypothetical protein B1218_35240, partial [Pseudomonas ogarae]